MALTFAQVGDRPYYINGAQKKTVTDVSMDNSYLSGGEVVTAANLRLNRVDYANAEIVSTATTTVNAASAGYVPGDGSTTSLLHVFDETPAEVSSTSDLAGLVIRVTAYGY